MLGNLFGIMNISDAAINGGKEGAASQDDNAFMELVQGILAEMEKNPLNAADSKTQMPQETAQAVSENVSAPLENGEANVDAGATKAFAMAVVNASQQAIATGEDAQSSQTSGSDGLGMNAAHGQAGSKAVKGKGTKNNEESSSKGEPEADTSMILAAAVDLNAAKYDLRIGTGIDGAMGSAQPAGNISQSSLPEILKQYLSMDAEGPGKALEAKPQQNTADGASGEAQGEAQAVADSILAELESVLKENAQSTEAEEGSEIINELIERVENGVDVSGPTGNAEKTAGKDAAGKGTIDAGAISLADKAVDVDDADAKAVPFKSVHETDFKGSVDSNGAREANGADMRRSNAIAGIGAENSKNEDFSGNENNGGADSAPSSDMNRQAGFESMLSAKTAQKFETVTAEPKLEKAFEAKVVDGVDEGVRVSFAGGGKEVTIKLHPRELGELTISMSIDKNSVVAEIQVDSESIRSFLESDMASVKEVFSKNGLTLDKYTVELSPNAFDAQNSGNRGLGASDRGFFTERQNAFQDSAKDQRHESRNNEGDEGRYHNDRNQGIDIFI